ncbi:glucose-6-phosphate dehydrogenase [Solirubrobacter soli]|uniref:glucose-6-phosphate dehydrogenase n=1 Tax=Solirubrobacter soli TaxID=363832 RepID=UPI0004120871|nr:glucose-6-phosphate dehydrogenase [Solirubrobacter soli]
MHRPEATVIGLVGGTGDLARRMVIPGCFHLMVAELLPEQCRIVGLSLDDLDDDGFKDVVHESLKEHARVELTDEAWERFAAMLSFGHDDFAGAIGAAERELGGSPRRLFHLAVPPSAAAAVVRSIDQAGLADRERTRVILEKPFGTDLDSARTLNADLHEVFDEAQIFRIDHFLGKEGLQNILALRFANAFVEPVFDRDHVDSIQIDVPEQLTIEGRAGFYEQTGCLKDMVTTHLLQVLGFVAMEPPVSLEPDALRDRTGGVFQSMRPIDPREVVYGQYDGYRSEPGVAADSTVETLVAARVEIDSWRWAGVPIFLRTGKAMAVSRETVTVVFKEPPMRLFARAEGVRDARNALRFELHDPPAITLEFLGKEPGPELVVEESSLDFGVRAADRDKLLAPYERLFHDALIGDQTLFTRADGVERVWEVAAPLLAAPPSVQPYAQGSWGPDAAERLTGRRGWELSRSTPGRPGGSGA